MKKRRMTKSLLRRRVHKLAFSCLGYPFHVLPTLTLFFSSFPPPPPSLPFSLTQSLAPSLLSSLFLPPYLLQPLSLSLPFFLPLYPLCFLPPSLCPSSLFTSLPSICLSFSPSTCIYLPFLLCRSLSFFTASYFLSFIVPLFVYLLVGY